jgi:hypothetical protein
MNMDGSTGTSILVEIDANWLQSGCIDQDRQHVVVVCAGKDGGLNTRSSHDGMLRLLYRNKFE